MKQTIQFVTGLLLVALAAILPSTAAAKPLKVFILAGQSNMQGWTSVDTFDYMATEPKTAPVLKEIRGADGKPRVCEKVWISSIGCAGDDTTEQKGKLTAGFGVQANRVGPEFTFGIYLEKMLDEPILLIKTSWGGKDLHTSFRSPSAGPYEWSDSELSHYKNRSSDLEKAKDQVLLENGFTPDELKRLRRGVSNLGFHYLGAAKIIAPIGKAFAEAMASLQTIQPREQQ